MYFIVGSPVGLKAVAVFFLHARLKPVEPRGLVKGSRQEA
jgi:hypothetical protein